MQLANQDTWAPVEPWHPPMVYPTAIEANVRGG